MVGEEGGGTGVWVRESGWRKKKKGGGDGGVPMCVCGCVFFFKATHYQDRQSEFIKMNFKFFEQF